MTDRGPALDELTSERAQAPRVPTRSAWVRRGLAGAALVAAVALLGPSLLSQGDKPDEPRPEPTTSPGPTSRPPPTEPALSALRWTVRGDLAGNTEFAEAALAAVRVEDPGAEKVLYAGTLPDRSRIALVGTGTGPEASGFAFRGATVHALHVPAGKAPSAGRVTFAGGVESADGLAGWAGRVRNGEVVAVLLGRPTPLDAQVSTAIDYSEDGDISRSWEPVHSRDGSAVVELGRDTDPLVVARTTYDDTIDPLLMSVDGDLTPRSREAVAAQVRVAGLDGAYRGPARRELRRAVVDGAWALLDPRSADIRVLWSGRMGAHRRGALLLVRRSDGPTFQLFVFQEADGRAFPQGMRHLPWAGADTVPWILQTGQPETPLTLVNPTGAGTAVIEPPGGQAARRVPIGRDGTANLGDDQAIDAHELSGSVITVLSPKGREVATTTWSEAGYDFDPFALESP